MTTHINETVTLNNGKQMPWLGLGVFRVEEGSALVESVKTAVKKDTEVLIRQQSMQTKLE